MIFFDKVSKIYSKTSIALEGVSLSIGPKEFVSLVGHSGAGKSTLLKLLLAEEAPSKGSIYFESVNVHSLPRRKLPLLRRKIGVVFQEFRLLSNKTVYENVAYVMQVEGKENEEIEKEVPRVLDIIGLSEKVDNFPDQLSGGEQQRLAIARALVNDPEIVLADEPTANLDSKMGHEVVMQLKKIAKDHNKSVLIVSHDNRIRDIADRVLWLEDGKFKELAKMVIDPVCGMSIEKRDYKYLYKDKEFYFCSPGCMKEFKGNVDQYPNTSTL